MFICVCLVVLNFELSEVCFMVLNCFLKNSTIAGHQ